MTEKLQIEARRVGPTTAVLVVLGPLDAATVPTLLAEGAGLVDAGHCNLVLDLTSVASCDAAAAGVFLDLHQLARNLSGQVVLTGIRGLVQRQLERTAVIGTLRTTLNTRDALIMLGTAGTG
ncbi:STAS domain-containing protein [Amycolatopsis thermoflava]|uniref:STAS domain-containing protein n=1 Tax=Amycolatopsis thermoflava TaxID=84480 RepID=UPI00366615CB